MDHLLQVRIPEETWTELQASAKDRGLAASALVRMLIIEYLRREKEGPTAGDVWDAVMRTRRGE